jgi:hypothetical protein
MYRVSPDAEDAFLDTQENTTDTITYGERLLKSFSNVLNFSRHKNDPVPFEVIHEAAVSFLYFLVVHESLSLAVA